MTSTAAASQPHQLPALRRPTIPLFKAKTYIGRGSFATTFAATSVTSGRRVALKVIEGGEEAASLREARSLSKLSSPFIVRLFDAFRSSRMSTTLVCELCGGTLRDDLRTRLRTLRLLEVSEVWEIIAQLASALNHLHLHRTLHRDVKPANIFLVQHPAPCPDKGTSLWVKLGDLGLAHELPTERSCASSMVGTMAYSSPELLQGEHYAAPSDVFALGCIAYECVTASHPFAARNGSPAAICFKIVAGKFAPLGSPQPADAPVRLPRSPDELPCKSLCSTINAMLAPRAARRPTAAQLVMLPLARAALLAFSGAVGSLIDAVAVGALDAARSAANAAARNATIARRISDTVRKKTRVLRRRHTDPLRISLPPLPMLSAEKWAQSCCGTPSLSSPREGLRLHRSVTAPVLSPRTERLKRATAHGASPIALSELCAEVELLQSAQTPSRSTTDRHRLGRRRSSSLDSLDPPTDSHRRRSSSIDSLDPSPTEPRASDSPSTDDPAHVESRLVRTARSIGMRTSGAPERSSTTTLTSPRSAATLRRLARRFLRTTETAAAEPRRDSFTLRSEQQRKHRTLLRELSAERLRARQARAAMGEEEARSHQAWGATNARNLAAQERTLRRRSQYKRRAAQRDGVLRLIDDDAAQISKRIAEWEATVASPPRCSSR